MSTDSGPFLSHRVPISAQSIIKYVVLRCRKTPLVKQLQFEMILWVSAPKLQTQWFGRRETHPSQWLSHFCKNIIILRARWGDPHSQWPFEKNNGLSEVMTSSRAPHGPRLAAPQRTRAAMTVVWHPNSPELCSRRSAFLSNVTYLRCLYLCIWLAILFPSPVSCKAGFSIRPRG